MPIRGIIRQEWSQDISEVDLVHFNLDKKHNLNLFWDIVDFRKLGGYAVRLQETQADEFDLDGCVPILGRRAQEMWARRAQINLAFGRPAVVAYPLHEPGFQGGQSANTIGIEAMDRFLRAASGHVKMLSGSEHILMPIDGLDVDEYTYPPDRPLPEVVQIQEALIGRD